jgi:hypothetical protein
LNASGVKVVLQSSPNPSKLGQAVTFTATVNPTYLQGTPTGSMTFRDGSKALGNVTLASGTATFATSRLSAGAHTITASYSGDSLYVPFTSQALRQTVTK